MRRRLKVLLLVAAMFFSMLPQQTREAPADNSYHPLSEGTYYIRSAYNGKALDVQSGADYNTCNVATYWFNGSNAQLWEITGSSSSYRIKPRCTVSRVLNQYGDYVVSGHNVNLWDDIYDPTQRWVFTQCSPSSFIIRCAGDPNCVLDVASNGNVYVSTYQPGKTSQEWYVNPAEVVLSEGNFRFKSVGNGNYLDVQNGADYNGCNVGTYTFNGSGAQTWHVSGPSNWLKIKPLCTANRVLNQYGYTVASGNNVNIWDDVYDGTVRWTFEFIGYWGNGSTQNGGYDCVFAIHCAGNPACVLSLDSYGNVCVQEQQLFNRSQLWVLEYVGN